MCQDNIIGLPTALSLVYLVDRKYNDFTLNGFFNNTVPVPDYV